MSVNYLTENQIASQLNLGRSVEQWLGHKNENEYRLIKWLRIDCEKMGHFSVTCFEVFDEGFHASLDIYSFSALDPDYPYGDIITFDKKEDALNYAQNSCGAFSNKFVGAGVIQDIYAEFLRQEGLPPE